MSKSVFHLKIIDDQIDEEYLSKINELIEKMDIEPNNSQALYVNGHIFLPTSADGIIDDSSIVEIRKIKKKQLKDYTQNIVNEPIRTLVEGNENIDKFSQGTMKRLAKELNKISEELSSLPKPKLIERVDKKIKETYLEQQINQYIKKIQSLSNDLSENLILENSSVLSEEQKETILREVENLESHFIELRAQFELVRK